MIVQLKKPELESYINEQVRAGHFPSAEAVIENALARVMVDQQNELTDEDIAGIREADEQFARGEGIDAEEAKRQIRSVYRRSKP